MRMKIVAIFGCILIVGSAFAHSGASGIVKERMDNMKAIAGQMKVLGDMMKGEATFDHQAAKQATEALLEHASHVAKVFERRNLDHPTEALPLIWEDWEGFTAIAAEMERDVARLNDVIGIIMNQHLDMALDTVTNIFILIVFLQSLVLVT